MQVFLCEGLLAGFLLAGLGIVRGLLRVVLDLVVVLE